MSIHTQAAEVLDSAADYIEQHGWLQGAQGGGNYHDGPGSSCVANAIGRSTLDMAAPLRAFLDAAGLPTVDLPKASLHTCTWEWNDAEGRDKQEVLDTLRYAAKAELRLADEAGE